MRAHAAVVGVRATAVEDARSNDNLGRVREGSGVVIGADGLVLTIGYLILEAQQVDVVLEADRVVPARVVAYDLASGFGLLQPLVPLRLPSAPMGSAAGLSPDEPLMVASGGEEANLSLAHLVSRRAFSGYWEYHIDSALFTTPPRTDHSGAGLFNAKGELLGIGSLVVMDALGQGEPGLPGNMFVPVDLLEPIYDELRARGMSRHSRRAWLGVNCVEVDGQVRVARVASDSPAEAAGALPGDHILRIDGTPVADLERFYKTLWRGSEPERVITLLVSRGGVEKTLRVRATDRMKTLRQPTGI
ncbi:S1C family serine protease [Piscinibacter sp.]|uniref:S1C family serine protease n=1 Tax=Piscinibacter sp. TaxID=1903157 RepID=UPI002C6B2AC1|nr:S1C family serine protease [Albitalea sp.]HUG23134.1 S1C family serine protease [Albitalea sp.]